VQTQPKQKTQLKGVIILLLTALIWGVAFVAQSAGMDDVGPLTFSGTRTLLGAIVLLPVIIIRDRAAMKKMTPEQITDKKSADKKAIINGCVLGLVFCIATNTQQYAFLDSAPGKIAFITALYIFFVPLLGLFIKKKVPLVTWICVVFGLIGLYFLCIDPANLGAINKGDLLAIICSVIFSVHILLIEKFAPDVDGIKLSCIQFAVAGVISCILMFIFEDPQIAAIKSALIPILYAGILSCGLAYTFQIVGQKYTEATVASLLLCMESVFGVIASAIILHDILAPREIFGCAIMFAAIILSQFSDILTKKLKQRKTPQV